MVKKILFRGKRALSILLTAGMLFQSETVALAATGSTSVTAYETTESESTEDYQNYGMGYIVPDVAEALSIYTDSYVPMFKVSAEALQSYYKTETLPAVRNQGQYGLCWAYATIGCIEINLMKKGYPEMDLSEVHLGYYSLNSAVDPLGGLDGDSYSYSGDFLNRGGNRIISTNALLDWMGAVAEETVPYSMGYDIRDNGLDDSYAYSNVVAHLQDVREIAYSDTEAVKQAIVDYGAVKMSYYQDYAYIDEETGGYYSYEKTDIINHACAIVGWDDNYSASNFLVEPEGDGAWIVRNSWGSGYALDGYFYLSYYDPNVYGSVVAFGAEPADNYDNNYQYDGSAYYNFTGAGSDYKAANVFQAKANPNGAEEIEAVSFSIESVNCDYTVSIYKDLTDMENPESGELCATVSGETTHQGTYTVKLDEAVYIDEGIYYSVVIRFQSKDGSSVWIRADQSAVDGEFVMTTSAKEHQSYMYRNGAWSDVGVVNNTNIRIKAYTSNVDKKATVAATKITLNKTSLDLNKGKTFQLSATVKPDNATSKAVVWSSSDTSIATVDGSGLVKGIAPGKATITAKTKDGKVSSSCTVNVKVPLSYIVLNYINVRLDAGDSVQLTVTYYPQDTTDNKTATWVSSDPSVATVDKNGLVKTVAPGTATITATVGEHSDTTTVVVLPVYISSISVDVPDFTIEVDESVTWTATVSPSNATSKLVTWTSEDESVAVVDSNGKITGVGVGSTTIKASALGRYGEVAYSHTVIVNPKTIPLDSIKINTPTDNVDIYNRITLGVSYLPADTTDLKTVTWTTSDSSVATVSSQGVVYGKKAGEVTITATSGNCRDSVVIRVNSDTTVAANGILMVELTRNGLVAGLDAMTSSAETLQYYWSAYNKSTGETIEIQNWMDDNQWINWKPDSFGEYVVTAKVRPKYNPAAVATAQTDAFEFNPYIKGKCQMPWWGEGGGYLIGVESYENPNQSYQYEMLILDCTLLAEGKPAWVYTTNKFTVTEGAAGWCVWQPQYGYYWTLFRVYDAAGNMIDQACYPFVNAY